MILQRLINDIDNVLNFGTWKKRSIILLYFFLSMLDYSYRVTYQPNKVQSRLAHICIRFKALALLKLNYKQQLLLSLFEFWFISAILSFLHDQVYDLLILLMCMLPHTRFDGIRHAYSAISTILFVRREIYEYTKIWRKTYDLNANYFSFCHVATDIWT